MVEILKCRSFACVCACVCVCELAPTVRAREGAGVSLVFDRLWARLGLPLYCCFNRYVDRFGIQSVCVENVCERKSDM